MQRRYAEAVEHLGRLLSGNPADDMALAMMGEVSLFHRDLLESIVYYTRAINANPSKRAYKERFLDLASNSVVSTYRREFEEALIACFRTPELDCTRITLFWTSLLVREPDFHRTFHLGSRQRFDPANAAFFESLSDFSAAASPLFLEGLRAVVAYDPLFEEFVAHLRRHMLGDLGIWQKFGKEIFVTLASAVSHYAFATDYILDVTDQERAEATKLRNAIQASEENAGNAAMVALAACYGPLDAFSNAKAILSRFGQPGPLRDVVLKQIREQELLREAADGIPIISVVAGTTSAAVKRQYETHPYPRWKPFAKDTLLSTWHASESSQKAERSLSGRPIHVLVAGCGTGQEAAIVATIFPRAQITAVDLSRTSLAYAKLRAKEMGLDNIEFLQGDIVSLGSREDTYDYISSVGVLHHMEDPIAGWRTLCGLLKPDGLMRIGLYSERSRRAIVTAQQIIQREAFTGDEPGMLKFRRASCDLLSATELDDLAGRADYYYLSMYRDLLFPAKEHRFDARQIKAILADLDLSLVGFRLPSNVLAQYSLMFPNDPNQTNLYNWHEFEAVHPDTFKAMFIFWCRKREKPA